MKYYQIAHLSLCMDGIGEALKRRMKGYEAEKKKPDIILEIDRERLQSSGEKYPHLTLDEWEYIWTGSNFGMRLPDFDGLCLHASAVAFQGKAFLFSGPCGRGKSTHTNLWQRYFGRERAVIINDDKPVLRLIKDNFYVYGTPWSGKSLLNVNICVPLGAIVFLKQAKENKLRLLSIRESIKLMIHQSMRPNSSKERMNKLLLLIDKLLKKVPVYQLECNISFDAVELVYNEIYKEELEMEKKK